MEWDIFDEMQRMQEEIERMFTASSSCTSCQGNSCQSPGAIPENPRPGSIPRNPQTIPGRMEPVADVQQTPTNIVVTAGMPGMEKEDIDLTVTSEKVEIKARKNENGLNGTGREYHAVIPLPVSVKSQDATATCRNGILEITLPKDNEAVTSQNVEIK
ncbi:MAG: Hsp20/alpha crystallin family protein [Theionarchaea archaeon]|nr:Hsp20/alpha crystallin family protein [Theionarchaea archaeon]